MSHHISKVVRLMSDLLENVRGAAHPALFRDTAAVRNGVIRNAIAAYPPTPLAPEQ